MKTKKELFSLFPDTSISKKVKAAVNNNSKYYSNTFLDFVGKKEDIVVFDIIESNNKSEITSRKRYFVSREEFVKYDLDKGTRSKSLPHEMWGMVFIGDYKKAHKALNSVCKQIPYSQMTNTKVCTRFGILLTDIRNQENIFRKTKEAEYSRERFKDLKKPTKAFVSFCRKEDPNNRGYFNKEDEVCSCPTCRGLFPLSDFTNLKNNKVGTHKACGTKMIFRSQKTYSGTRKSHHFSFLDMSRGQIVLRTFRRDLEYKSKIEEDCIPSEEISEVFRFIINNEGFIVEELECRSDYGVQGFFPVKPTGMGWYRRPCTNYLYKCTYYEPGNSRFLKMMGINRNAYKTILNVVFEKDKVVTFENVYGLSFCFSTFKPLQETALADYPNRNEVLRTIARRLRFSGFAKYEHSPLFSGASKQVVEKVLTTKDILKNANTDISSLKKVSVNYNLKNLSIEEIKFLHNFENVFVGFDLKKVMDYVESHNITRSDYRDYIKMAQKVIYNKNRNVPMFPTDFKSAHDELVSLTKKMVSENDEARFKEVSKEWNVYEYEDNDYTVIPPQNCEDIITEGLIQNVCLANYVNDVLTRESTILFLRKKEKIDEPYVAFEIRNGVIVQARGKANINIERLDEKAFAFLTKFSSRKKVPMAASFNRR